jgi:hypothetical protein
LPTRINAAKHSDPQRASVEEIVRSPRPVFFFSFSNRARILCARDRHHAPRILSSTISLDARSRSHRATRAMITKKNFRKKNTCVFRICLLHIFSGKVEAVVAHPGACARDMNNRPVNIG